MLPNIYLSSVPCSLHKKIWHCFIKLFKLINPRAGRFLNKLGHLYNLCKESSQQIQIFKPVIFNYLLQGSPSLEFSSTSLLAYIFHLFDAIYHMFFICMHTKYEGKDRQEKAGSFAEHSPRQYHSKRTPVGHRTGKINKKGKRRYYSVIWWCQGSS
jgi:hypothetical protein